MRKEDLDILLEEYAARLARGEHPDVREYISRAGADGAELAHLLDRFLARATPSSPDPETVELMQAWRNGEGPLLVLRKRRRLRVDEVVGALIDALGIDDSKRTKVKRYYQQLEGGLLAPGRVSLSVFETLGQLFGARASELASLRPRAPEPEPIFLRRHATLPDRSRGTAHAQPVEPDEVDRLFGIEP